MAHKNPDPQGPAPGAGSPAKTEPAGTATNAPPVPPLSPAFLWLKLVESWKRDPWATIAVLAAIAGAVVGTATWLGPWFLPAVIAIGFTLVVAGLGYLSWSVLRFGRFAMEARGRALGEALLLKEFYAVGLLIAATIIISVPSTLESPRIHMAEAQLRQSRHDLDQYLSRDEPDDRTDEQKLADSIEFLAQQDDAVVAYRFVSVSLTLVRFSLAAWALLIAVSLHGIVMAVVLGQLSGVYEGLVGRPRIRSHQTKDKRSGRSADAAGLTKTRRERDQSRREPNEQRRERNEKPRERNSARRERS